MRKSGRRQNGTQTNSKNVLHGSLSGAVRIGCSRFFDALRLRGVAYPVANAPGSFGWDRAGRMLWCGGFFTALVPRSVLNDRVAGRREAELPIVRFSLLLGQFIDLVA